MPTDTNARPWARIGMWLVIALAFGNALLYTLAVCNPLIGDDNWTFVDTFLRHALQDGVQLGDFLVKRAGVDHAQPLNKLLAWTSRSRASQAWSLGSPRCWCWLR